MSHHRKLISLLFLFGLAVASCKTSFGQSSSSLVKIEHGKKTYFGKPIGWDGKQIALLARDGRLNLVPVKSKEDLRVVSKNFEPFSAGDLREVFLGEYKSRYDVSTTEHFVVVHPWGNSQTWAQPFEDFYLRFASYFESKGVELETPNAPLIAFVLRSRNDFDRSLINEVERHDSRIAGYYSRITNRITTYDPGGQLRDKQDQFLYSAWPIIHEATHQFAFNTGLHNRFAPPPLWLSEGLATMFEAKGLNNHEQFSKPVHRVNKRRLKELRKYLNTADFNAGLLNLIANDKLFHTHSEMAYSISWGLSFYLAETNPEDFFEFVKQDAQRPDFSSYSSKKRMRDFAESFGYDFKKLASQLKSYYRKK